MSTASTPDISEIKHSFASRLSLYIVGVCAFMFLIAAAVFLVFAGKLVKQEATNHAQSELNNTVHIIDDHLHQVQVATLSMEWAIRQKLHSPDELIELAVQLNENNPQIVGSCIAFRPHYYKEKGDEANMFVTMFIGVIDLDTGLFTCCNAGHNPPILAPPSQDAAFHNIPAYVPIGIIEDFPYTEQSIELTDHAAFFIYTDGVNEAENTQSEMFGNQRMLSTVKRHSHESARSIVCSMLDEVDQFANNAEQSDDITLLCLRYHKNFNGNPSVIAPKTLTITNKTEDLKQLPSFIENYCACLPTPPSLVLSLNLAIEEALVNCIHYAYPNGSHGNISLTLTWDDVQHELKFVLRDSGSPFDPTQEPEPDTTLKEMERPIGGLGILLVRKLMDTVSYQREGDVNILTMCKKIYAHADAKV